MARGQAATLLGRLELVSADRRPLGASTTGCFPCAAKHGPQTPRRGPVTKCCSSDGGACATGSHWQPLAEVRPVGGVGTEPRRCGGRLAFAQHENEKSNKPGEEQLGSALRGLQGPQSAPRPLQTPLRGREGREGESGECIGSRPSILSHGHSREAVAPRRASRRPAGRGSAGNAGTVCWLGTVSGGSGDGPPGDTPGPNGAVTRGRGYGRGALTGSLPRQSIRPSCVCKGTDITGT